MVDRESYERVAERIDSYREEMIALQGELTAVPAISPDNGGRGEYAKARVLKGILDTMAFDAVLSIDAPDDRAEGGVRPNLVCRRGPKDGPTTWIVTHMDIVPPGELSLWEGDPHQIRVRDGRIYGRGVEDNQQDLVASLFAAKALLAEGGEPKRAFGLVFVADEETASSYGLDYILNQKENPFGRDDLIVVPDSGNPEGTLIEIAEKSILWLRFQTKGKQCHGSRPDEGRNAFLAASHLVVSLDRGLHGRYPVEDPLFDPPRSTFQPTRKDANVPNVNTIPGDDVFYMDCRILPRYDLEEVMNFVRREADRIEGEWGVTIKVEHVQRVQAPPPTAADAPVVRALKEAVREVYGLEARAGGIGAGTVAAYLRRRAYPVAVWSRSDNTAHQPNEYCVIDNMVGNAKVFAHLFLNGLEDRSP